MTKNLKIYISISILWSVAFFTVLRWALEDPDHRWPALLANSLIYASGYAVGGSQLGKRDDQSRTRLPLGPAYGLASTFTSALVGVIYVMIAGVSGTDFDSGLATGLVAGSIVASLILFFVMKKRMIKGIPSKDLFK